MATRVSWLHRLTPNLLAPSLGANLRGDFQGALTGALAAIPLTIAYGLIIGGALGASYGGVGVLIALYGSVVVSLAAVLLGGNPLLVAGPRASTLLVLAALISQLSRSPALADLTDPLPLAFALGFSAVVGAGALKLLYGAFRLGRLINYVPLQVVAGFMNGTALLVVFSQVWAATGIPPQKSFFDLFSHLEQIRPAGLFLAMGTALALKLLPRQVGRVPSILLVFIAGTALYHGFAAFGWSAALGGTVPPPPEHFSLKFIGGEVVATLAGPHGAELISPILLAAVSMSILSSLDTLLASASVDHATGRRSKANRQLMAEGIGNTLAGMFGMSPGSGSAVRTHAALKGGMTSALGTLAIALITLIATVALGAQIGKLPQAVMAGMLIALGLDLIDKWTLVQVRRLFSRGGVPAKTDSDLLVVGVVVATALMINLAAAVGMGMLLSLLSFVMQMAHSPIRRCYPATALIPHFHGDIARRNFVEQHGKSIAIIEIEGALFFGTSNELESSVETLAEDEVIHVVIDLKRVKHIDATGARALERIHARLAALGGMLVVSHAGRDRRARKDQFLSRQNDKTPAVRSNWEILTYLGAVQVIGEERFLRNTDSAVAACERHLAARLSADAETRELLKLNTRLIRRFDRSMLRRLRSYWTRVSYAPGEIVFVQDSQPDGMFFLVAGRVDVLLSVPGTEHKRKLQSLTAGAVFGEMALIDPVPRAHGIIAVEPTICYWMTAANFDRLKQEQSDIALALLANVAMLFVERLHATDNMLADLEA